MSNNIELGINEAPEPGGTLGAGGATDIDKSPTSRPQISSHASPSEAGPSDGSGALFSIYLRIAEEEDKKMTDNWKDDAKGIILFTTLFSVIVAGFLALAYPNLQQSSQDTSAFYLAHLYQVSAANSSIAPVLPLPPNLSDPSTFSPSSSAIWVNVLWFMSLILSLTCALLATMLQQWARRYLRVTGKRHGLHKRARIRTFIAEGTDKWYLPWVVEALPGLLHASVFLFFAGLPIFLFGTNHTVFAAVLSCVVTSGLAYLFITFMPLVCHDSPYHTPLSTLFWFLEARIRLHMLSSFEYSFFYFLHAHAVLSAPASQRPHHPHRLTHRMLHIISTSVKKQLQRLQGGPIKEVEISALESSWEIDARGLSWAFDFLDDEHDLEQILAAIPSFYNSGLVKESQRILTVVSERISSAVLQLMDRSLSSDLVQEDVRKRRSAICLKVLEVQPDLRHATIQQSLHFIGTGVFKWIDLGLLAERDDDFAAKCVTALVTAYTRGSDGRFPSSIMHEFRVSESYVAQEDDLLFSNLLDFMLWLVLHHHSVSRSDFQVVENVLNALCKFDVAGTSPELQHPFCALWNDFWTFRSTPPRTSQRKICGTSCESICL